MISLMFFSWHLFYSPTYGLSWWTFHIYTWKEYVSYSCCASCSRNNNWMKLVNIVHVICIFTDFLSVVLWIPERIAEITNENSKFICFGFWFCQFLHHVFWSSVIRSTHYVFFMNWPFYYHEYFCLSLTIVLILKTILFNINIATQLSVIIVLYCFICILQYIFPFIFYL